MGGGRHAVEILRHLAGYFSKRTVVYSVVQTYIVLMFDKISPRPLLLGLHLKSKLINQRSERSAIRERNEEKKVTCTGGVVGYHITFTR